MELGLISPSPRAIPARDAWHGLLFSVLLRSFLGLRTLPSLPRAPAWPMCSPKG